MDLLDVFAANLKDARVRRGLTLAAVAEAAGLHVAHVARIERAEREPGIRTVAKLARALDVSIADLCEGMEEIDSD